MFAFKPVIVTIDKNTTIKMLIIVEPSLTIFAPKIVKIKNIIPIINTPII